MLVQRKLQDVIEKWLFRGKILIIYGARQTGKTTLSKEILKKHVKNPDTAYFNCEINQIKQSLQSQDPLSLKRFLGEHELIVLDEAQHVPDIGLVLKLLIDTYPKMQIIATGSSSFDLSNKINEPLTGRALEFSLCPFSLSELSQKYKSWEIDSQLENILRFGSYPEIINSSSESDAKIFLDNISSKYLYKDILEFENIKKSDLLFKLIQLLALQLGNEVSIHELAISLQCNRDTIVRYLDLLEKSFIIFKLKAFSRNLRKEITKKQKIYFYDLGIRNSVLSRYNKLETRDDVGALWENFCIVERLKFLQNSNTKVNQYFWRTQDQKEIDYIEEYNDELHGYEFKWGKQKFKQPKEFLSTYKNSTVELINKDNYHKFLL